MIRTLVRLFVDSDPIYECRECGTTLERPDDECPTCGSTEIAEYELGRR